MAKYSTGGGAGGDAGGACELCGQVTDTLREASIAGASLAVCPSCAPHDDRGPASSDDRSGGRPSSGRKAAQHAARMADAASGDGEYWVEHGTDYERDPLPYLRSGYGKRVAAARRDAGFTLEELASNLDVPPDEIEAIEQNRAARAGVGGSVVRALEVALDVDLTEETD